VKIQESGLVFSRLGIKNTRQRAMVFDLLKNTDTLLTAEQIYYVLRSRDENINLSTVYRILELFVSKGIIKKLNIPNENVSAFEMNRPEHRHHLICMKCKKVIPIGECPFKSLEKSLRETTEFDITGHNLEVFGYCPECKHKSQMQ